MTCYMALLVTGGCGFIGSNFINLTGTINLTNPGAITHNEILAMYKEIVDPTFTWENFTVEEKNQILASERSNNLLDTTKLQSLYPNAPLSKRPFAPAFCHILFKSGQYALYRHSGRAMF